MDPGLGVDVPSVNKVDPELVGTLVQFFFLQSSKVIKLS